MGDEDDIVGAIAEEAAEAAKAIVADVKAIAAELADAVTEGISRTPPSVTVPVDTPDETAPGAIKKG